MDDVNKIIQKEAIHPDKQPFSVYEMHKRKRKKPNKKAKAYLSRLTRIVDETHKELEEKQSPFRLCIYQDGEDVYIDIVTIDDTGKIDRIFKHDISHAELEDLIDHIKSGRGLILDADA